MMSLTEAKRYSLALWSHGSAWLPPKKSSFLSNKGELEYKSFGQDGESELSLNDLAESLPERFFSIAFDACFMASVEVAYALRYNVLYFLFSPTEVLPDGFPYEAMPPYCNREQKKD